MGDGFHVVDERGWTHTRVDNYIIDDLEHLTKAYEKMVYIALVRFANIRTKSAWPSVPKLANMAGCSENSVRVTLRKLEELKFIETEQRNGKAYIFRLLPIPSQIQTPSKTTGVKNEGEPLQKREGTPSKTTGDPFKNERRTIEKNYRKELEKKKDEEEEEKEHSAASDKTEQPIENRTAEIFDLLAQNGFGFAGPILTDDVNYWIDESDSFTDPYGVIIEAIKEAVRMGVTRWKYVNSILVDLAQKNVQTGEQVRALLKQREQQRSSQLPGRQRYKSRGPRRMEPIPKWMDKEPVSQAEGTEVEEMRRQLEKELQQL